MGKEEFIQSFVLAAVSSENFSYEDVHLAGYAHAAHKAWALCFAETQKEYPDGYSPEDIAHEEARSNGSS